MQRVAVLSALCAAVSSEARFENLQGYLDYTSRFQISSQFDYVFEFGGNSVTLPGFVDFVKLDSGSACRVKYRSLPWEVQCDSSMEVVLPKDQDLIENGNTLLFKAFAGLVFDKDPKNPTKLAVDFKYGVETPDFDFNLRWLEFLGVTGKMQGITFPPEATAVTLQALPLPDLSGPICIFSNLPILSSPFPQFKDLAKSLDLVSGMTGTDICVRFEGLDFDMNGSSFKFFLSLHFLDEKLMTDLPPAARNAIINLRNALLKRETGIIVEVDIGKLIFGGAKAASIRGANSGIDVVLTEDGAFNLGARANEPPAPDAALPEPDGNNKATLVVAAAGSLVALVAVGSAIYVKRKRNAAESKQGTGHAVANPSYRY